MGQMEERRRGLQVLPQPIDKLFSRQCDQTPVASVGCEIVSPRNDVGDDADSAA